MRRWLHKQVSLLRCGPRIIAAVVTGNLAALHNVEADINTLHERWHGQEKEDTG
jgi:hypothetical protein